MTRFYILDANDRPQYVGVGAGGRAIYDDWCSRPESTHLRLRGFEGIGVATYTLEFDGVVDGQQSTRFVSFWKVIRRTANMAAPGRPDQPDIRQFVAARRHGLDSARGAFSAIVNRERRRLGIGPALAQAGDAAATAGAALLNVGPLLLNADAMLRADVRRIIPQQPAAEITTDLIGTPIEPENRRTAR